MLIDLPRDILAQKVAFDGYQPVGKPLPPRGNPAQIEAAAAALRRAARPLILAGGGAVAADAQAEVRALAEALQAPVLTTLSGRGSLPDDHPLAAGGIGHHRTWLTKRLLPEADVVLGLGCRFEEQETNWRDGYVPDPRACYIQVDIDPAEIGRSVVPQLAVVGDVRLVLRDLLEALKPGAPNGAAPRLEALARDKQQLEDEVAGMVGSEQRPVHPMRVIGTVREVFGRDATAAIDVGVLAQGMGGAFPYFKVYAPRSCIVPSSFYGMGFCVVRAAGRKAGPSGPPGGRLRRRRLVPDDHERAADRRRAQAAGDLVRAQRRRARLDPGRPACRLRQPHHRDHVRDAAGFRDIAQACQCHGERVDDPAQVRPALERARDANARGVPAVIDFIVARERLAGSVEFFIVAVDGESDGSRRSIQDVSGVGRLGRNRSGAAGGLSISSRAAASLRGAPPEAGARPGGRAARAASPRCARLSSNTSMVPAAVCPSPRIWKCSVSPLHTSCSIAISVLRLLRMVPSPLLSRRTASSLPS